MKITSYDIKFYEEIISRSRLHFLESCSETVVSTEAF